MKKQITLLSGLLLATGAMAQVNSNLPVVKKAPSQINIFDGKAKTENVGQKIDGALVWGSDFSVPADWTIATTGQGTFEIGTAGGSLETYIGNMASTTQANGFGFFNGVQYLLTGTPAEQNTTMTSPVMDFTVNAVAHVEFEQRYRAFNRDVTYVEFSTNNGTTWESIPVNVLAITNAAATQNTIALDFQTNNSATCKLRFRWESLAGAGGANSGYGWMIDDVKVQEGYANNLKIEQAFGSIGTQALQYTKFPVTQAAGLKYSVGADVKNVGYTSQDAFITVSSGAFTVDGTNTTLPSFASDSLSVLDADGFPLPLTPGVANVTVTAKSDNSTLQYTADDAKVKPFEMTASVMGVDAYAGTAASLDGYFFGFDGDVEGDLIGLGTYFEVFQTEEVGSLQVGIGSVSDDDETIYTGRTFFVRLYEVGDTEEEIIFETDEVEILANDFGKLKKIYIDPIELEAGKLYIAVVCSYVGAEVDGFATGGIPVATAGLIPGRLTIALTAGGLGYLGSDPLSPDVVEAPVVRLDFTDYASVAELEMASDVVVAPNPFSAETAINFTLKADAEVSVVITDLSGRTVLTVPAKQMAAGTQSVSIDGSAFTAGVYNYSLTVAGNTITKRIVKK